MVCNRLLNSYWGFDIPLAEGKLGCNSLPNGPLSMSLLQDFKGYFPLPLRD